MTRTSILDTNWLGHPRSIGAVLLESDGHRAILDPGPASSLPTMRDLLRQRGVSVADLHAILLTHIHLDHAGATGTLVKENPSLEVYVHKAGMRHLADPSKLLASADRLWPGQLQFLFGEALPVPLGNLRMLIGGETLSLGKRDLQVFYTPGHASHHVSYFDASDGTAYVGDTTGFHIEPEPYAVPLAPPPDIDLEGWNASLDAILARRPERLFLTHFGYSSDPPAHIREYRENLRRWAALAEEVLRTTREEQRSPDGHPQNDDPAALHAQTASATERFVAITEAEIRERVRSAEAEHYLFNVGLDLTWLGLARYHKKRAAAAASAPPASLSAKP